MCLYGAGSERAPSLLRMRSEWARNTSGKGTAAGRTPAGRRNAARAAAFGCRFPCSSGRGWCRAFVRRRVFLGKKNDASSCLHLFFVRIFACDGNRMMFPVADCNAMVHSFFVLPGVIEWLCVAALLLLKGLFVVWGDKRYPLESKIGWTVLLVLFNVLALVPLLLQRMRKRKQAERA